MKSTDMIPGTSPHQTTDIGPDETDFDILAQAAHDEEPPEGLWNRIDAELEAEQSVQGISFLRAQEGTWQAWPNGVWKKVISARPDGVQMYLVRCEPGAHIPGHHHKSVEQVFVLEGEFRMSDIVFRSGDSQIASANTEHPDIFTENGCLLLIVA